MIRVAVDGTAVRGKLSGIGVYTLNLLRGLTQLADQPGSPLALQIYYQPGMKAWIRGQWQGDERLQALGNCRCVPLPVTVSDRLGPWVGQWGLGADPPDIIHGTDHYVFPGRGSRLLLTIHDLTFVRFPQFVPPLVHQYDHRIRRCLPQVAGILTFADNTKAEIQDHYHFPGDRIFVVPQASRYASPISLSSQTPSVDYPYFLFVSTLEPRKNVVGLITAFNHFKHTTQDPHHLVLIGQLGWKYAPILEAIAASPFSPHIHHLAYVPDGELAAYYQGATAFVYPSFYEGFGLPVLEAMAFGLPVITANVASLPEVAGPAALYVDPQDPLAIAAALTRLATDRPYRTHLRHQSLTRSAQFSWEATARQTLAVYQALMHRSPA